MRRMPFTRNRQTILSPTAPASKRVGAAYASCPVKDPRRVPIPSRLRLIKSGHPKRDRLLAGTQSENRSLKAIPHRQTAAPDEERLGSLHGLPGKFGVARRERGPGGTQSRTGIPTGTSSSRQRQKIVWLTGRDHHCRSHAALICRKAEQFRKESTGTAPAARAFLFFLRRLQPCPASSTSLLLADCG